MMRPCPAPDSACGSRIQPCPRSFGCRSCDGDGRLDGRGDSLCGAAGGFGEGGAGAGVGGKGGGVGWIVVVVWGVGEGEGGEG